MAIHYIDVFTFQFWRSEPPLTVCEKSESYTRFGVNGVGKVRTGKRGPQFQVTVEEDMPSYLYAMGMIPLYHALPNIGPKTIVYNGINYMAAFNHLYLVDDVEVLDCRAMPRLVGPNYDYIGGARISVRWTLTPYYIEPVPET